MAKITLITQRQLPQGYHLYTLATHSGHLITVRRKLASPTDYQHQASRPTQQQRQRFTATAKRWAAMPYYFKKDERARYGWITTQQPHGTSQPQLLHGKQLYTAEDIHMQNYQDTHKTVPPNACITTISPAGNAIPINTYATYNLMHPYSSRWPTRKLTPTDTLYMPLTAKGNAYIVARHWGYLAAGLNETNRNKIQTITQHPIYPPLTVKGNLISGRNNYSFCADWKYTYPATYNTWWQVDIYHRYTDEQGSLIYYNMANLQIAQIDPDHLQLHLTPYRFDKSGEIAGWKVTHHDDGSWTLDPPELDRTFRYKDYSYVFLIWWGCTLPEQ